MKCKLFSMAIKVFLYYCHAIPLCVYKNRSTITSKVHVVVIEAWNLGRVVLFCFFSDLVPHLVGFRGWPWLFTQEWLLVVLKGQYWMMGSNSHQQSKNCIQSTTFYPLHTYPLGITSLTSSRFSKTHLFSKDQYKVHCLQGSCIISPKNVLPQQLNWST